MRVVLVGAGHAHLGVLKAWADAPPGEVTVVTRVAETRYSGMLPGVIAGHYPPEAMRIAVAPVAARAGATLVVDEAVALDPVARRLRLRRGGALDYDLLSLDVGSEADMRGAPGIGDRLVPLRPVESFLERWEAARARHLRPGGRVAVAGGGAAGCEVALALAHRLGSRARLVVVERGSRLVPEFPAAARRRLACELEAGSVEVRTGADAGGFDVVVWATGPAPAAWLAESGLACDARGWVRVTRALRSASHPSVFAAGDIAALATPRAKAGVFAVRASPALARNLAAVAAGGEPEGWRPQRRWLSLVGLGDRRALAVWNGLAASGRWAWAWKDRIDRGFVAGFR